MGTSLSGPAAREPHREEGKRREDILVTKTPPVAGADTGPPVYMHRLHVEARASWLVTILTTEHDLNCVRLMRSSAPILARARPTASALEASSRSSRATHRRKRLRPVGSTRTLSAVGGSARGRVSERTPFHLLVEEKVARLGGADDILRADKAGLHMRLVHQGHVDVVEADPVLVRGTRW